MLHGVVVPILDPDIGRCQLQSDICPGVVSLVVLVVLGSGDQGSAFSRSVSRYSGILYGRSAAAKETSIVKP